MSSIDVNEYECVAASHVILYYLSSFQIRRRIPMQLHEQEVENQNRVGGSLRRYDEQDYFTV